MAEELTPIEMDAMAEVGNIVMGAAATALTTLAGKTVQIVSPELEVVPAGEVKKVYAEPCIVVDLQYASGFTGNYLFIYKEKDIAVINNLMNNIPPDNLLPLDDIGESTAGEAINQMMSYSVSAMSEMLSRDITINDPLIRQVDPAGEAITAPWLEKEENVVKITFRLIINEFVDSTLTQLMPVSMVKKMINVLLNAEEEEAEPAAEPEPPAAKPEPETEAEMLRETGRVKPEPEPEPPAPSEVPEPEIRAAEPEPPAAQPDVPEPAAEPGPPEAQPDVPEPDIPDTEPEPGPPAAQPEPEAPSEVPEPELEAAEPEPPAAQPGVSERDIPDTEPEPGPEPPAAKPGIPDPDFDVPEAEPQEIPDLDDILASKTPGDGEAPGKDVSGDLPADDAGRVFLSKEKEASDKSVSLSFEERMEKLDLIKDIPIELTVIMGENKLLMGDLVSAGKGSVISINRYAREPVDIMVNDQLVARGEVVVVDGKIGVKVTSIESKLPQVSKSRA